MQRSLKALALVVFVLVTLGCVEKSPVETLRVDKAQVRVYFASDLNSPIQYDQYKGRSPDPTKHRMVEYRLILTNTGTKNKEFVLVEPILQPAFREMVINSSLGIPVNISPGRTVPYVNIYYLAEGNPDTIEKLAYLSKIRIVWAEEGRKWSKVVSVTPAA